MRKSVKKEEVKVEEVKVEKKPLKECFVLWKKDAKTGLVYLTGSTPKDKKGKPEMYLKGFFNSKKKNPKEPDIRVYTEDKEDGDVEVATLWTKVAKSGNKYLSGKTNEDEYLVGWYGEEDTKQPYVRVYYQEDNKNNDDNLPF